MFIVQVTDNQMSLNKSNFGIPIFVGMIQIAIKNIQNSLTNLCREKGLLLSFVYKFGQVGMLVLLVSP